MATSAKKKERKKDRKTERKKRVCDEREYLLNICHITMDAYMKLW
jgi:hypothetical protein